MGGQRSLGVAVIGGGYVGTVVAACFARLGHRVAGLECHPTRLAALRAGRSPVHEPGLEALLVEGHRQGRLRFGARPEEALAGADAVFVCVGTPEVDGKATDLSALVQALTDVRAARPVPRLVVVKSTVPLGTCRRLDAGTGLVHNPEFLRQGSAVGDFLHPDRIVLGGDDPATLDLAVELYHPILDQDFEGGDADRRPALVRTDLVTAETVKHASNAFLAAKVSFINELAGICDRIGADVADVAIGMGLDHRIGHHFLEAGLGWGGSCLGKDLSALIATARGHGQRPELLEAVAEVNRRQREWPLRRLESHLKTLDGRRVGVLGLAFKAGTDDVRDSPALDLARRLVGAGCLVRAYDPVVGTVPAGSGIVTVGDPHDVADGADAVVLATAWPDFMLLDLVDLARRMRGDLLLDGRNFLEPSTVEAAGLRYEGIGRPAGSGVSREGRATGATTAARRAPPTPPT